MCLEGEPLRVLVCLDRSVPKFGSPEKCQGSWLCQPAPALGLDCLVGRVAGTWGYRGEAQHYRGEVHTIIEERHTTIEEVQGLWSLGPLTPPNW